MKLLRRAAGRLLGRLRLMTGVAANVSSQDDRTALYRAWFQRHAPSETELAAQRELAVALPYQPLVTIVTPVYNTQPGDLAACIASVISQSYTNWEWCLCDDASTSPETIAVLRGQTDPRIRIVTLERNSGIAIASQTALDSARGDFVAFLDSDDELTPDALHEVARLLNDARDTDVVYSDEDKLDEDGGYSEPFFKPDWSPEHLLSAMYTCHFTVARASFVREAGGFRTLCEGSQDHDLMLRLTTLTSRIRHLPKVLYHWRRSLQSGARVAGAKSWADEAGQRAVDAYLKTQGVDATVVSGGVPGLYRPRFAVRGEPLVSIVIVARAADAAVSDRCAKIIRARTTYRNFEIVITDDADVSPAGVNASAGRSRGAHLVFLDARLDVIDGEWLTALLEYSQQDTVGAVGAKLHEADGRLRHIGLILGVGSGVARAMHGHPEAGYGYFSSAIGVRNYSAVSAECLMTPRALFDRLGGFDVRMPWSVADVDYCLRAEQLGRRTVFTPYARLRRRQTTADDATIGPDAVAILRARWGQRLERDPYYNPNLSRASSYQLAP